MRIHDSMYAFLALALVTLANCSNSTDSNSDFTPPPTPTGVTFENNTISNGMASLLWDPVRTKDIFGYHVWWSNGTEINTTTSQKLFTATPNAVVAGLEYDSRYTFAVSAVDKSGNESPLSAQISGVPSNTTGPLPPSGVNVTGLNMDYPRVIVFWQKNREYDVDHYNVYRSTESGQFGAEPIGITTTESFADTTVTVGTFYYYTVTAVDFGDWESRKSDEAHDLVLPRVGLMLPADLSFITRQTAFSWQPVEYAVSYYIVVTDNLIGGEIWKKTVGKTVTLVPYKGPKLKPGNTYYWRIGAISKSEINSISETRSFVAQ